MALERIRMPPIRLAGGVEMQLMEQIRLPMERKRPIIVRATRQAAITKLIVKHHSQAAKM